MQSTNAEVKRVGLDLFQQWALAFESKPELNYVCDVYRGMKNEGIGTSSPVLVAGRSASFRGSSSSSPFALLRLPLQASASLLLPSSQTQPPSSLPPPLPLGSTRRSAFAAGHPSHSPTGNITAETVERSSTSSARATRCRFLTSGSRRKSGSATRAGARAKRVVWPSSKSGWAGKTERTRLKAHFGLFVGLVSFNRATILHHASRAAGPAPAIPRKSMNPDSDLARAIALSLAESQASSGTNRPGFVPVSSEPPIRGGRKEEGNDGEEDEDLRAAIEASLKEMRDAPSAPVGAEDGDDSRKPVSLLRAFEPRTT